MHLCVCLASHSIAVDLRVPDREGAPRGRVCYGGKTDAGRLHGVPSHCDVVPSTLKDRKGEREGEISSS